MKVSELAKEYNTTSDAVLAKLKSLKLKAKDKDQEISSFVVSVLRSEFKKSAPPAKPKIEKEEPVKESTPVKKAAAKETKAKAKAPVKEVKAASKTTKAKKTETKKVEKTAAAKIVKKSAPAKPAAPAEPVKSAVPAAVKPVAVPPVVAKPKPVEKIAPEPFVSVKPLLKKKRPMGEPSFRTGTPVAKEPLVSAAGSAVMPGAGTAAAQKEGAALPPKILKELEVKLPISVKDFSVKIQEKPSAILKTLMQMGFMATINQNLDEEVLKPLAEKFGYALTKVKTQEEQLVDFHAVEKEDPKSLKPRAPVVTFMGHVDHGKTSLLDRIRKSRVADREHGGITQHLGSYSVNLPKGRITFLDTPGHEAFTAMRARGAHITDLVVLVVAADEGIMPQTEEAINHARAANVPIVVALNKIDKKNADLDRVKKQLSEHNLLPEDWGGKTITVGVSATTGAGVDQLLEMILLEAELLELKANADRAASGIVVEAHLSHGKGAIASLIVQNGTLHEGEMLVVGPYYGRVKAMFDDYNRPLKEAGPSMAVEVLGLPGVPEAGERFYIVPDERQAREIAGRRQAQIKEKKMQSFSKVTLEDLYSQIQEGKLKELNVIIKSDVQGSLEALIDSLKKIPSDQVKLNFIHTGIGDINASDLILAMASAAIIIGFQVEVDTRAKQELERNPVDVRTYRIIYDAVNDIKNALEGLLEPKTRKKFLSRVEVRQVFKLSKSGMVAGSFVQKGRFLRKSNVDVIRNGEVVFSGTVGSLKRFKDDVREVSEGVECGISINGYDQIEPGDIIEAYELEKIARKL